ncbi:hydrophobin [Suillus decipiens]|nr:hydrophobin [Suillus decipiens]
MFALAVPLVSLLAYIAGTSAASVPALSARGGTSGECNTGTISCCDSTYAYGDPSLTKITSGLGISLDPFEGFAGVDCSPMSVVGAGSGAVCTQEPVCCSGNTYYGIINIGCSPINIYL